jgi:hypothetical protein
MPGRRSAVAALAVVWLGAAGCGSSGPGEAATPPGPSGSLGVVTQPAVDRAVRALCSMLSGGSDRAGLTDAFENRAHEELHVIAAATQERDRTAAGAMLVAKERVEADLAEPSLPRGWRDDDVTLLRRTQDALVAIGLGAPACDADPGYRPGSDA